MKQKQHKVATRVSGYAMAFLICCSTVLVKQHYFIDIVGGVGVAALSYLPIKLFKVGEKIVINHPSFLRSKLDVVKTKKLNKLHLQKAKRNRKSIALDIYYS
ncbi:MAG: hypothetical protein MJ201_01075 [Mycoplasmoidaceae bacterium]|nr:hypothetical protein [Mycoplasmoidaceae bacterium]